jgi:DNA-binding transcriptional ArsR family regulator
MTRPMSPSERYEAVCAIVDRVKMDERNLDTDQYASEIEALFEEPIIKGRTINWERIADATGHPTVMAVVRLLSVEDELSPKDMAERLGMPLGAVSYHVRRLAVAEVIHLVREEPRRGALEHFYSLRRRRNGASAS